jgi:hypothetical protein
MFSRPRDPRVVMLAFGTAATPTAIPRTRDPAWFDGFRTGAIRAIAQQDLEHDLTALDAADHVHVIAHEPRGVTDLTYLTAAWDEVRALGSTVIFDAIAMKFYRAAPTALDVEAEIRVVYETDATASNRAHALHTRGMRKFGAPDLVALCTDDDVELVGTAIRELADQIARGTELAKPRHALAVAPDVQWFVVEDEHRIGDLLQLDNEVRVLVDGAGHDLVGISRSRPRSRPLPG